jgi:translation initiation factor 2 subunit 3
MVGHVDHGKTSLTKALAGKWTDTHSEEVKRGITIKIGYADTTFYKDKDGNYTTAAEAEKNKERWTISRRVSFLDAPGHETLMTTTIAASSIIDGALLVIAANEPCPQPQTEEHLMVLNILGIKKVVVVQNKIDLVSKEKALENYKQIRQFLKGSIAEDAPIIPVSANYNTNIDKLVEAIEKTIPTPKRDPSLLPRMYVARSFDANKPGTQIDKLSGGIIGGSLIQGVLRVGDEIEILPGISYKAKEKEVIAPAVVKIRSLMAGNNYIQEAKPGGLIGIETTLDPSLTKADKLIGTLIGKKGGLPPVLNELNLEYTVLKREGIEIPPIKLNELIVISAGTATTVGIVTKLKPSFLSVKLKRPICTEKEVKVAITRKIGQRWRLAGFGVIK